MAERLLDRIRVVFANTRQIWGFFLVNPEDRPMARCAPGLGEPLTISGHVPMVTILFFVECCCHDQSEPPQSSSERELNKLVG